MKSFVEAQFGYCPLVWMFHSREINRKINHIHEMKDPLPPTNASSIEITIALSRIYLRRVILSVFTIEKSRVLALQQFKVKGNLSNTIMSYIFPTRVLNRSQTDFFKNTVNATKLGLNALRYFASKVWSMIPKDIKNFSSVELFKNKSGSLTTVTANFVKIIFIELDMLTRLMTNSVVVSVLIQAIADSRNLFTYKLEGCRNHLQM